MRVIFESDHRPRAPAIGWKERAVLSWGKIRRFYLLTFRRAYVEESLQRRVGVCRRTGSCCKLSFTCPWLKLLEYLPICSHYAHRPRNCVTFPIDERDIRDRDIVSPHDPCGYSFLSAEQARKRAEEQREVEVIVRV